LLQDLSQIDPEPNKPDGGASMSQHIFFAGKTVLLVEDDLLTADKLRGQLKALGFGRVLIALDLEDAASHRETHEIDAALLDVNLRERATTLKLGWSLAADNVPIVFFSGFNVEAMSKATRGHELMEKPISLPRLKAALLRAVLRAAPGQLAREQVARRKMAGQGARQ
jgi:DNA-binding response OmpR family regulator